MFQNAKIKSIDPDPRTYRANEFPRGDKRLPMSSSSLKTAAWCFSRWVDGYESPESQSKNHGNLLDCLALTPGRFAERYAVQPETYESEVMVCVHCDSISDSKRCKKCGVDRVKAIRHKPWNNNSVTCAAWVEEQTKAGREVASFKHVKEAREAAAKLRRDEVIAAFIDASDKQVWVSGEWVDESTELVIPVQCLIDLVPRNDTEFYKCLGDFKTARSAHPVPWRRQVYNMGYHTQGAFNLDLYRAARPDEDRCQFVHIVQENYEPWQTGKRILSEAFMDIGRTAYRRALKNYAWCLKHGRWPGYDETDEAVQGWTICEPDPFMESAGLFEPRFIGQDEEIADCGMGSAELEEVTP